MIEANLHRTQPWALAIGKRIARRAQHKTSLEHFQHRQHVVIQRHCLAQIPPEEFIERVFILLQIVFPAHIGAIIRHCIVIEPDIISLNLLTPGFVQTTQIPIQPGFFPKIVQFRLRRNLSVFSKDSPQNLHLSLMIIHQRIVYVKQKASNQLRTSQIQKELP